MTLCKNIQLLSISVYHYLSDVYKYRLSFSELGLTDHFILNLAQYSHLTGNSNVEIYKMPWTVESIYGNDIDLFIQNKSGTYTWYALQAKVMAFNGAFKDLKYNRKAILQQWDKLLLHETIFGSKSYYLLYSGKSQNPPKGMPNRSDCKGIPSIDELGLGIVETSEIKNIRTKTLSQSQQFFFKNIFPLHIDSIRKLFCCSDSLHITTKQFKRDEIDTSGYKKIYFKENNKIFSKNDEIVKYNFEKGLAPIRLIIKIKENSNGY